MTDHSCGPWKHPAPTTPAPGGSTLPRDVLGVAIIFGLLYIALWVTP